MTRKAIVAVLAGAAALLGLSGQASAFHSGGVAECAGCHVMHNAASGLVAVNTGTGEAPGSGESNTEYLLKNADQTSTCLSCHNNDNDTAPTSYHISSVYDKNGAGTGPVHRSPGGDFAWISKTYTWVVRGSTNTSEAERHGHNIVAADFAAKLYEPDPGRLSGGNVIAPGAGAGGFGTAGEDLTCIACHDPHGRYRIIDTANPPTVQLPAAAFGSTYYQTWTSGSYGSNPNAGLTASVGVYRLLGGRGYVAKSWVDGGSTFEFGATVDPPVAVAPSTYNRTESSTYTRVAYGQGMAEWCANCHAGIHNNDTATFTRHPAGNDASMGTIDPQTGATYAANYDAYVKTGDLTGVNASSYTSLIPFEEGTGSRATLLTHAKNDNSYTVGPDVNSNVMCLSCHRAHASGFDYGLRWNQESDFVTYAGHYPDKDTSAEVGFAQGREDTELQAAYYDRAATPTFANYQRVLCNKCHIKD